MTKVVERTVSMVKGHDRRRRNSMPESTPLSPADREALVAAYKRERGHDLPDAERAARARSLEAPHARV